MERFKTIIIILLSISAIVLLALNIGISPSEIFEENDWSDDLIFESNVLFSDGIFPDEIRLNFGGNEHTVLRSSQAMAIWEESVDLLKDIFSDSGYSHLNSTNIDDEFYYSYLKQKSLVLSFSSKVNLATILNALDIGDYAQITEDFGQVNSIYISLDKPFVIIESAQGKTLLSVSFMDTKDIETLVDGVFEKGYRSYYLARDRFETASLIYIPYTTGQTVERFSLKPIIDHTDEEKKQAKAYQFFQKEIGRLREIEDDKSTIYTDEEKILRIEKNGLVSFYDPSPIMSNKRNLFISMNHAIEYMGSRLGFDADLHLSKIKEIDEGENLGYRFEFSKNLGDFGLRVDSENISDYVVIDVYNDQIRRYSHLLRRKEDGVNPVYIQLTEEDDITRVVEENIDHINEKLDVTYSPQDVLKNLSRARLVYSDDTFSNIIAIGWEIRIEGQDFYFEIY